MTTSPAEPILYMNGEYLPLSASRISPLDQGFLLGDGIFDVVSAWQGVIFKLEEHLDRFFDSVRAARLETRLTREQWREAIIETTRRNQLADASIRFILTRGVPDGVVADPREIVPTEMIWAAPYIFLADDTKRREGIRLMISASRGFSPDTLDPRFKCLDRLNSQLIRLESLEAGYDDAVWLDTQGYVAEAAASNIFVVKKGQLYSPRPAAYCTVLPGPRYWSWPIALGCLAPRRSSPVLTCTPPTRCLPAVPPGACCPCARCRAGSLPTPMAL